MERQASDRLILVGGRRVALPPGVTAAVWALERNRYQNARIRTLLGAIGLLERVLDSNTAILHCSPGRAREIWHQLREVAAIVQDRLGPLLLEPSPVPRLDQARRAVALSLKMLEESTLVEIARRPERLPDHLVPEIRKLLCVLMGRLHAFLQDSFGALMGADPRSHHDQDYFLSKRFRRDVEEGEWLYHSVSDLNRLAQAAARDDANVLEPWIERLSSERWLPSRQSWEPIAATLERVSAVAGKLSVVLGLHGIRFEELELLHGYSRDLPLHCRGLELLYSAARDGIDDVKRVTPEERAAREHAVAALTAIHDAFSRYMLTHVRKIHEILMDLTAFLPIWLGNISKRRSMLLHPGPESGERAAAEGGAP